MNSQNVTPIAELIDNSYNTYENYETRISGNNIT